MHEILRKEVQLKFAQAKTRNGRYSLRAFASHLDLNHSALSELLNGKRKLSAKKVRTLAMRLGLSPDKILAIESETAEKEQNRSITDKTPNRKSLSIPLDQFENISGWLPFAVLSLMETDDFDWNVEWMSKRLKITKRELIATTKRLHRLGFVTLKEDGSYKATGEGYATPEFIANEAMRYHHLQNLDVARKALEETPIDERYFSSITMTLDPTRLAEAKIALAKFRDEFCVEFETPPKQEVYRLILQFFPLTTRKGTR